MERLSALELESAVAGANGAGERIAAGFLYELLRCNRVGEAGVAILDLDVLLDAAEHAELSLDRDALGMGLVDHALGDLDILVEWIVGGIDHDRAEKTGIDAFVAGFLVPMVEVHREDRLGKDD